jgi:hypothetical protein
VNLQAGRPVGHDVEVPAGALRWERNHVLHRRRGLAQRVRARDEATLFELSTDHILVLRRVVGQRQRKVARASDLEVGPGQQRWQDHLRWCARSVCSRLERLQTCRVISEPWSCGVVRTVHHREGDGSQAAPAKSQAVAARAIERRLHGLRAYGSIVLAGRVSPRCAKRIASALRRPAVTSAALRWNCPMTSRLRWAIRRRPPIQHPCLGDVHRQRCCLTMLAADERLAEARYARDDVTARSKSWR